MTAEQINGQRTRIPPQNTTFDGPPRLSLTEHDIPVLAEPQAADTVAETPGGLPWTVPAERRPIAPAWVLDAEQRRAAAKWAAGHAGHTLAFHAVRMPKYGVRAVLYIPRGAWRSLTRWVRWVIDHEAHGLRLDLIQRREAGAYHQAARHRDDRVRNRAYGSAAALAGAAVAGAAGWALWSPSLLLACIGAVAALIWHGRPVGKPFLVDHAVLPAQVSRLTLDVVARALASVGIADLRKAVEKRELAFITPITRDGPGWRAEVDLPHGITAVDVIEKRAELASGLRRPLGCVWPEPADEQHTGRLVLWVGDRTLAKSAAPSFPLLNSGVTDMFKPLPFGVDQRGRPQTVCLMFASMAVGAQPRMGKTVTIRVLALGAALDVTCELHIYDGKGMGDWVMFELVAHTFLSGSQDNTLAALRDDLAALKVEVDRRAVLLTKLTREGRCREGKITPELAKVKAYRLHHILIALDECHLAFDTGTGAAGKLGEEIAGLAEYLVRVGPAAGVSLIAATQRPDAKSLPSGIRANVQLRFCLRVADQPTNDMVLGTSAYKSGVRATEFALSDKGIGYLSGEGTVPVIAQGYNVDATGATKVLTRARALREAAGTLSGIAAGVEPERRTDPGELLADVLAAIGEDAQIWSEAICVRLAENHPGRYAGWDATTLGKALKGFGVSTGQTWWTPQTGPATNKNGVRREQIVEALKTIRNTSA